ncbi:CobW family GTP-binding protein [Halioxenophilus aromaticivorans]|uniref:GTP-binding protein n=1 Tax=Halioxenophilus aromaticivorans TaxID=1306992 RepID=A0AAV3U8L8_9ALTE
MTKLTAIPTNVITGFLGVGKTTAILNLLQQKPSDERWAILVNEFGEVGIDGELCNSRLGQQAENVFIKEVPGGCMCCAAGLPMQMAMNMLLAKAKPQRLLIEPTGLGHPREVLDTLGADYNQELLALQATITLVDARKIKDARYTQHATFNQQLDVADVIVANKSDLYKPEDFSNLLVYLESKGNLSNAPIYQVQNGELQPQWLQTKWLQTKRSQTKPLTPEVNALNSANSSAPNSVKSNAHTHHHPSANSVELLSEKTLPEEGYLCLTGSGDGFHTVGWIFDSRWVFNTDKLNLLLLGIPAERIKGVLITSEGITVFNKADDVLTQSPGYESDDSRLEIISDYALNDTELTQALMDCLAYR